MAIAHIDMFPLDIMLTEFAKRQHLTHSVVRKLLSFMFWATMKILEDEDALLR